MNDLYQSMCLEFRHGNGKVLGIQPHPTLRSASTHCVPNPNPSKGPLICYSKLTHTLTSI